MNRNPLRVRFVVHILHNATLLAALLVLAPIARADEGATVSWWVEARPWNCSDLVAPLAREIELACDAAGGICRIARSEAEATQYAVISCTEGEAPWNLDAEGRDRRRLWSVALEGDRDERLRKAALWVARGEDDRGSVAASVAPPAAPPAPPASPAVPAAESTARDAADTSQTPTNGGLAFSAFGARTTYVNSFLMLAGARVLAATRLAGGARLGLGLDAEHSVADGLHGYGGGYNLTAGHLGAVVGFGAPWTDDWVGVSGEAGVAKAKGNYSDGCCSSASQLAYTTDKTSAYLKLSLIAQWPRREGLRPFLGASYIASDQLLDQWVTLDLGAAWSLW
jgi:hypothetical protein